MATSAEKADRPKHVFSFGFKSWSEIVHVIEVRPRN